METKHKILVVDDDTDLLIMLEKKLTFEGYDVKTASTILKGVEIISTWRPQLILLDVDIHGEDGRKVCSDLKDHPKLKQTKVIIMSGYDQNIGAAAWFGADEMLEKPLVMQELLEHIRFHLAKHELDLGKTNA
jgi:DNA-binding response OmpR family regulator